MSRREDLAEDEGPVPIQVLTVKNGRIYLKEVMGAFDLRDGDQLAFFKDDKGKMVVRIVRKPRK
jgi:hypothetical protein